MESHTHLPPVTSLNTIGLVLGIVGVVLNMIGAFLEPALLQKWLFFIGALCLFTTAYIEKHRIFIALEVVVVAGTLIAFSHYSALIKSLVPCVLALVMLLWLMREKQISTLTNQTGALGLILLAVGYATSHPFIYLAGGIVLSVYAFIEMKQGIKIATLWFVLNVMFSISALVGLIRWGW